MVLKSTYDIQQIIWNKQTFLNFLELKHKYMGWI